MPEKHFDVIWPDGVEEKCYSPSSVIEQYLNVGQSYSVSEFTDITERALNEASERVRKKYGYACSSALDQLSKIKQNATQFENPDDVIVTVKRIS